MARLVGANVLRYFIKLTKDCIDDEDTGTHEQAANPTLEQPRQAGMQEAKKPTLQCLPPSQYRIQS